MATPERKQALRLVPAHRSPSDDAHTVAFNIMEFINSEFPEMLLHASLHARLRLRNRIIEEVLEQQHGRQP